MPKSETNEAVAIAAALRPTVDEWERESSRSCVRMKKMTVATVYNSSTRTMGVREAFAADVQNIPCVPCMRGALVGSPVWVQWLYGDKSTMCVVRPGDISEYIDGAVNPNLIDNWYFIGGGSQQNGGQFHINQRGQTVYNGDSYTIDRWRVDSGITVNVNPFYVRFTNTKNDSNNYIRYRTLLTDNPPFYRTVTGTILYADGTMDSGSIYVDITEQTDNWQPIRFFERDWGFFIYELPPTGYNYYEWHITLYPSSHVDIAAIKVEYGTASTLCYYDYSDGLYKVREVPNYQTALLRCKRYYQHFNTYISSGYLTSSNTQYIMPINLDAPIHPNATVTAGTWTGRKASGGYSAVGTSSGVAFQSLSVARQSDAHYRITDTRSSASSDTNNSMLAYYIRNLTFKYDI